MLYTLHKSHRTGKYMDYSPRAYFVFYIEKNGVFFLEFGEDARASEAENVLNLLNHSSNA